VLVVSEMWDMLARVEEDVQVRESLDFTELTVEVLVKVCEDTQWDHYTSTLSW
jgi:hypothetical protein